MSWVEAGPLLSLWYQIPNSSWDSQLIRALIGWPIRGEKFVTNPKTENYAAQFSSFSSRFQQSLLEAFDASTCLLFGRERRIVLSEIMDENYNLVDHIQVIYFAQLFILVPLLQKFKSVTERVRSRQTQLSWISMNLTWLQRIFDSGHRLSDISVKYSI